MAHGALLQEGARLGLVKVRLPAILGVGQKLTIRFLQVDAAQTSCQVLFATAGGGFEGCFHPAAFSYTRIDFFEGALSQVPCKKTAWRIKFDVNERGVDSCLSALIVFD